MTARVEAWEQGPPPGRFDEEPATTSGVVVANDTRQSAPPLVALLDGPALAAPLPPLTYLVRELGIVDGGGAPHMAAGFGFVGKTIAYQAMLLALAADVPVWGAYRPGRTRRVAHVDLEQGQRLTARRYQRLALAMGIDLRELGDRLAVAIMPPISLTPGDAPRWRELMTGRDVLAIDALRPATRGADENDSGIRAGLDMLGNLSEATGCRAIVLHHARKPSGDDQGARYAIRGSSAIYDACDSVHVFAAEKGEPVLVEQVKARTHGEPTEPISLVIEDVAIGGDPKAGLRVVARGSELVAQRRHEREQAGRRTKAKADAEVVRRILAERPGLGTRDLRAAVGFGVDRFSAAIAALGDLIEVRDEVSGRSRVAKHYLRGAA